MEGPIFGPGRRGAGAVFRELSQLQTFRWEGIFRQGRGGRVCVISLLLLSHGMPEQECDMHALSCRGLRGRCRYGAPDKNSLGQFGSSFLAPVTNISELGSTFDHFDPESGQDWQHLAKFGLICAEIWPVFATGARNIGKNLPRELCSGIFRTSFRFLCHRSPAGEQFGEHRAFFRDARRTPRSLLPAPPLHFQSVGIKKVAAGLRRQRNIPVT